MIWVVIISLLAVLISFCCSITEAALYSISPSRVEELKRSGSKAGIRLARMRERIDEPIAAILTINTIANTAGPAIAGSMVGGLYGDVAAGVYGGLLVVFFLYCGEMIPKLIGVSYCGRIAPFVSLPLAWSIVLLKPIVASSQVLTRVITSGKTGDSNAPSENEILAMAEMGAKAGTILQDEARWAINALRLNDVPASQLLTPRNAVYVLPADLPLSMVTRHSEHWSFSRLPVVANNNPDEVLGIVHRRDVFDELARLNDDELATMKLRDLMKPAIFVPQNARCNLLLKRCLDERQQLLVVTDEYGGMDGVLSLEDILEFILGEEIVDPHDKHADMQDFARRQAERREKRLRSGAFPPSKTASSAGNPIPPA